MCMEDNILNSGIGGLKELKDKLIQLDRFQNENSGLSTDGKKLEKSIKSKETLVEDELAFTLKKRKEEIEATYNQEIEKIKEKIKRVQGKKEKSREAQVSERIKLESADLIDEYNHMGLTIKNILKEDKIPSFTNTRLFYSLYMPKGAREYGIIFIVLLLILLAIPCGIYFLILQEQKVEYLVIIYVVTVIIFGGLYILIGNKLKDKHLSSLKEIRVIRNDMSVNENKRNKIRKKILKDKDESTYALEHYDREINKLSTEIEEIESRKKDVIVLFNNETKAVIVNEIRGIYSEELLNMNTQLMILNNKIKENDENIKYLSRELVENYEAYLGKEFMSVENIDLLISNMEEYKTENVSQALAHYRKEK